MHKQGSPRSQNVCSAWQDGRITKDEQLLLNEVVDFLGMHPERVRRLSNEARREINAPPPEEIYLDMLRQALVDGVIHEEEEALLKTVQIAFDIDEKHINNCSIKQFLTRLTARNMSRIDLS